MFRLTACLGDSQLSEAPRRGSEVMGETGTSFEDLGWVLGWLWQLYTAHGWGVLDCAGGGTVLPALDRDARTANARFDCQATPARAKPAMYAAQRGRRHDGLWNYQD